EASNRAQARTDSQSSCADSGLALMFLPSPRAPEAPRRGVRGLRAAWRNRSAGLPATLIGSRLGAPGGAWRSSLSPRFDVTPGILLPAQGWPQRRRGKSRCPIPAAALRGRSSLEPGVRRLVVACLDPHVVDAGSRGPAPRPDDELGYPVGRSLDQRLHAAVGPIADPPRDAAL